MKSHMLLLKLVLEESGTRCCTSTTRDFKRITKRVEHEGLSFLTIALPHFCEDLQKGLDSGVVETTSFSGFEKKGRLPTLLLGFTSQLFNTQTGVLLDEPSIEAIHSLRQITLLFGKVNLPCSDARIKASFRKYIECEQDVRLHDAQLPESLKEEFGLAASITLGKVFSFIDRCVYDGSIVPKHGPGKTADKLVGNNKFLQSVWPERLEYYFPHGEFLFSSFSHFLNEDPVDILDPGAELPVKVVAVPKTLKTPRIIAIEPTCMQYVQQGLMEKFVQSIQRDDILCKLIGFDDQVPNQHMARDGASGRSPLATLDLSEASDRVSNQHVREMFKFWPHLRDGVEACRSRKADVPGHGVIRLAKFASMGSALCFPVEAMVFLTIAVMGIAKVRNTQISRSFLKSLIGEVRVYGDDIIVPIDTVHSVVELLESFGLKVNSSKSFWTGKFRESCGKEYYDGADVSIVRLRHMLPTQRRQVSELVSTVSFRNQMYFAGYWKVCAYLDDLIGKLIPFPIVEATSPGLGRHSFLSPTGEKECPDLQRPLVKAAVVSGRSPSSKLDGAGALLKCFLKRGDEPFADRDHLERAGRPESVNIKLRWVPTY
jgi:hypothetical protein